MRPTVYDHAADRVYLPANGYRSRRLSTFETCNGQISAPHTPATFDHSRTHTETEDRSVDCVRLVDHLNRRLGARRPALSGAEGPSDRIQQTARAESLATLPPFQPTRGGSGRRRCPWNGHLDTVIERQP